MRQVKVAEQEDAIRNLSNLSKDRLSPFPLLYMAELRSGSGIPQDSQAWDAGYATEMERRRGEEKGMWRAVHHKMEEDLKNGEAAKREAQYSLVQVSATAEGDVPSSSRLHAET